MFVRAHVWRSYWFPCRIAMQIYNKLRKGRWKDKWMGFTKLAFGRMSFVFDRNLLKSPKFIK